MRPPGGAVSRAWQSTDDGTPRRRQAFSSSHRLFSRELGEDASRKTYGKCTNVHGHNYVLFVTVRGEVGAADGMVMNLVDLKTIIQEEVMDQLDHKSIDAHPWFNEGERPSTVENVAVFCFERIHALLTRRLQTVELSLCILL